MKRIEGKKTKKDKRGRPFKHGGYSLMIRRGEVPERLTHIRRYLTAVREGLVRDIAGQEEKLTTAQRVLVDRAISLLSVLRTIESTLSEQGIIQGRLLQPILRENYLAYSNSLRLILRELGIEKRQTSEVLNLGRYIEQKDREAKAKGRGKAGKQARHDRADRQDKDKEEHGQAAKDGGIEAPGSTSSDIPKAED